MKIIVRVVFDYDYSNKNLIREDLKEFCCNDGYSILLVQKTPQVIFFSFSFFEIKILI